MDTFLLFLLTAASSTMVLSPGLAVALPARKRVVAREVWRGMVVGFVEDLDEFFRIGRERPGVVPEPGGYFNSVGFSLSDGHIR
jgi:hypothetical protein